MNSTITDKLEDFSSTWLKLALIGILVICQLFAYTLYPLIIAYERYGQDPQKRTILNKIAAMLCISAMLFNAFPGNTILLRLVYGQHLDHTVVVIFFDIGKTAIALSFGFHILEFYLFKMLTIFWWRQTPPINELFFANFLAKMNVMLCLFLSAIQNSSRIKEDIFYHFLSHPVKAQDPESPSLRIFATFAPIATVIAIAAEVVIQVFKRTSRFNSGVASAQNPGFNNVSKNKAINATAGAVVMVAAYALTFGFIHLSRGFDDMHLFIRFFMEFFISLSTVSIFVPVIFLANNPNILKFAIRKFTN